jgi:DNA (cytosine-5)-methyltransferase 1
VSRPLLLDLFCGAGGAGMGYHRAGFDVVGVDLAPQPNYPFTFYQDDALEFVRGYWMDFDAIHSSPPCHDHSTVSGTAKKHHGAEYVNLIPATRAALRATGLPYVIENVVGAPLVGPAMLCGSSFGLDVQRHRIFETDWMLWSVPCDHGWQTPRFRSLASQQVKAGRLARVVGVHGHTQYAGELELRMAAMGIDWMTSDELSEAIPPAYTEHIGAELLAAMECAA